MKKLFPLIAICLLLFQSCDLTSQPKSLKMINVNVEEFESKMQDENVVVLDVRTPEETNAGKIEGALEIDVKAEGFKEKIQTLAKNKTYLVYCRSGRRSVKACGIMEEAGLEKLYNLEGGFKAWTKEHK